MTRPIKAILLKELRESLPWAAAVFLITALVLAAAFYSEIDRGLSLVGRNMMTCCILLFPPIGLSLGLLQIFRDFRRGRWQFVSHRPVARSQLFWGKVAVGAVLYCLATIVPLAALTLWAATPGVVPGPFAWDMTQPALANIAGGLVWYAAGLLLAARQARWIGSRIMPLGIPLIGMFAAYLLAMTFAEAIAIAAVCAILLWMGAWGAFVAGGESTSLPAFSKPFIGLSVTVGWFLAVSAATAFIGEGIERLRLNAVAENFHYQEYVLAPDGQILLADYVYGETFGETETLHDLSGKLVSLPHTSPKLDWGRNAANSVALNLREPNASDDSRITRVMAYGFLNPDTHVLSVGSDPKTTWIYVPSRRTIEGFDWNSHRFAGSIGPGGFAAPNVRPEPFPGPLQYDLNASHGPLLTFNRAVFHLDVADRRVELIFRASVTDAVAAAGFFSVDADQRGFSNQSPFYVIATHRLIHILHDGREILTIAIRPQNRENDVTISRTDSGQFVVAYGLDRIVGYEPVGATIYDSNGKVVQQTDLPPMKLPAQRNDESRWKQTGKLIFIPPGFVLFKILVVLRSTGTESWLYPLKMVLVAGCYGSIAGWMARVRRIRGWRLWLWAIFAGLLGPSGLFVVPSLLTSFPSARCRSCNKRVWVSEANCPHCGIPVDPPRMEGIEIGPSPLIGAH